MSDPEESAPPSRKDNPALEIEASPWGEVPVGPKSPPAPQEPPHAVQLQAESPNITFSIKPPDLDTGFGQDPHEVDKPKYEYPDGSGLFYEIQNDAKGEFIIDGDGNRHDFVYKSEEIEF